MCNFQQAIDIASKIVGMVVGVFAVVSACIALKNYIYQKNRAAKDKACELARFFEAEILGVMGFIVNVLKKSSGDLLKLTFPSDKIRSFDSREMVRLIKSAGKEKSQIEKAFTGIDHKAVFGFLFKRAKTEVEQSRVILHAKQNGDTRELEYNKDTLIAEFSVLITDLLNKLEWFSTYFRLNVADESVVYQSLHQSYLAVVNILYFKIADLNVNNGNKYYTNIIELYIKWSDRMRKWQKKQEKANRKAEVPPHKPKGLK